MKRTKNMIVKKSDESRELYLFILNTSEAYFNILTPVLNNLKKHYKKGTYNQHEAITAYYHVTTEAAKMYGKMYGNNNGLNIFDVTARYTTATELETNLFEDITE